MFVGTILARRSAPCHPEGEARGIFEAAGKVPPFGFAQGKRYARDDNIALAPARAQRPTLASAAATVRTHHRIRLLFPARGRGWVRGMRTSLPPHLVSPPSGGEEF